MLLIFNSTHTINKLKNRYSMNLKTTKKIEYINNM